MSTHELFAEGSLCVHSYALCELFYLVDYTYIPMQCVHFILDFNYFLLSRCVWPTHPKTFISYVKIQQETIFTLLTKMHPNGHSRIRPSKHDRYEWLYSTTRLGKHISPTKHQRFRLRSHNVPK